jgi:hypothetical protein
MASRKAWHQSPSVSDVFHRWGLERPVCFMDLVNLIRSSFAPSLIGFEELGNIDVFETAVLELRLANSGNDIFSHPATCYPWLIALSQASFKNHKVLLNPVSHTMSRPRTLEIYEQAAVEQIRMMTSLTYNGLPHCSARLFPS